MRCWASLGKISSGSSRIHSLKRDAIMLASYSSDSSRRLMSSSVHESAHIRYDREVEMLTRVEASPPLSDVGDTTRDSVEALFFTFSVQITAEGQHMT